MSAAQDSATARALVPVDALPKDRPQVPPVPCAACGEPVDPLRAPVVLAFEDNYRFLCGAECLKAFRGGKRIRLKKTPALGTARVTPGEGGHRFTPALGHAASTRETPAHGHLRGEGPAERRSTPPLGLTGLEQTGRLSGAVPSPGDGALPALRSSMAAWVALFFAVSGLLLSPFSRETMFAAGSALCSVVSALAVLAMASPTARAVGSIGVLLGPAGTVLAALAGYGAAVEGDGPLGLSAAAVAAFAMLVRALLDADGQRPIEDLLSALTSGLPARAKIPVQPDEDPFAMAVQQVDAQGLRTGEEVIASRGDVLPVDGVVQAGSARVIPYPGAEAVISRTVGDAVLSGAHVVDGAVRVIATRVGDQRGLSRIAGFARLGPNAPNLTIRLGNALRTWGGPAMALMALATGVMVSGSRHHAALSAVASVLLAAPALAMVRALMTPLMAAGAYAGARGIVFQSAAALERAGRVSVLAMAPHGTLTEGTPEVVEMHMIGGGSADDLIALVAAAERAAGQRAVPLAIERFARASKAPNVEVRRAQYFQGRGVTAVAPNNEELVVGSRRFLLDSGISVAVADAEVVRAEASGRTSIFVALAGRVRAVISLQDHLRPGARAAIQRLFDMSIEVVLLTGDQRGPIETLASGLDVAHLKAELLPEERAQEVRSLAETGGQVAVVGHLGEDDAALSAADVGIALSAAGSAGTERAIALVSDDVRDAASALWMAQAAHLQSLRALRAAALAFGLVVLAAGAGLLSPGLAALVAIAVDAQALSAGARLLRRFAIRLPANS